MHRQTDEQTYNRTTENKQTDGKTDSITDGDIDRWTDAQGIRSGRLLKG